MGRDRGQQVRGGCSSMVEDHDRDRWGEEGCDLDRPRPIDRTLNPNFLRCLGLTQNSNGAQTHLIVSGLG